MICLCQKWSCLNLLYKWSTSKKSLQRNPGINSREIVNIEYEIRIAPAAGCMRKWTNGHVKNSRELGFKNIYINWRACLLISRRDNSFVILRSDVSWTREKLSWGAYQVFTHFVFKNIYLFPPCIYTPQLKHRSGNHYTKEWYHSTCTQDHVLKAQ